MNTSIEEIEEIQEIISTAHDLNDRLLGTEATADDLQTALAEVCEGGTAEEQQWVLRLAFEFALITCDPNEGMDLDEDSAHSRRFHYHYLVRKLGVHQGLMNDEGMMSYQEIHDRYPLRKKSDNTH